MKNTTFILKPCPPIERIRAKLIEQRNTLMTYSQIAEFWGISKGTAWRIVTSGYEPKKASIRKQLGLPEIITVPVYRNNKGRFSKGK